MLSKRTKELQLIRDYQLAKLRSDDYRNLIKKGFEPQKAIKYLKQEKPGSLEKLQHRVYSSLNIPGVSGISLENIRRTREVDQFIDSLVREGIVEDKGSSLYFKNKVNAWVR